MDHLPHDIPMLVSAINFLLRDEEYDNLDEICYAFHVDRKELIERMAKTELYILIAVFLLITIILVWFLLKTLLDFRKRRQQQKKRHEDWVKKMKQR